MKTDFTPFTPTQNPPSQAPLTPWGVYAAWQRNARVYQATWLVNSLPPLSEPLIYLVAFGYGLTPLVGEISYYGTTVDYLRFLAPGMMGIGVLFQSYSEGAYASYLRLDYQKTWHAILTTPLTFSEVFTGELLWAATKGMIAALATGLLAILWGLMSITTLVLSIPLLLLGSVAFAGAGLLTAGLVRTIDQINVPIYLLIVPMFTLCGTYFPRETLPSPLLEVAGLLPLSLLVDLLRWPLGLPDHLPWALLGLLGWAIASIFLAWRTIYPRLFR
ncbi:ABC transporter permease [Spirulina subsalsa FACHB-351]|uniref:Transport permease protein n=1 Tax=Spirulina subsalsa FACHB-351 TaxID=234711 RepID=A0ABT3LBG5_9CYAN|nr:ABC transporter permease [Spirulina subsalsa]MCW6038857.1 ABC transporter permease [Spirulina subsalsa FACHB-351]